MNNQETTLMERTPFMLPDVVVGESQFSKAELEEDMDGLQLGFQRVKIPSGG